MRYVTFAHMEYWLSLTSFSFYSLQAHFRASQSKDICLQTHMVIVFPSWEQEIVKDIKKQCLVS